MIPSFGAQKSPFDIRTFTYAPQPFVKQAGGAKYQPQDIEDQSKVGICTAISLTQNARKALGKKFSADFQYLIQKKFYDNNWDEGSSILNALKAAKGIGLLPVEEWTYTIQTDRDAGYDVYIAKLQAIPMNEIARLILIANQYRIKAYASVPVSRDTKAQAIDNSKAGILSRFEVGEEWYTDTAGNVTWDQNKIEPLRPPKVVISGHAITESNYDGNSFRVANTWSPQWCEGGTAYYLETQYASTESWSVFYDTPPAEVQAQLATRELWSAVVFDIIQKFISYAQLLK